MIRPSSCGDRHRLLLAHLEQRASEYGIDSIAVCAASGNLTAVLPAVQDPTLTATRD